MRFYMRRSEEIPFDSIENAQEYIRLLIDAVREAKQETESNSADAERLKVNRRVDALRLVQYKLERLEQHLTVSSRVLNDLRSLRRLLLEERKDLVEVDVRRVANQ
jgi:hypothetical protein